MLHSVQGREQVTSWCVALVLLAVSSTASGQDLGQDQFGYRATKASSGTFSDISGTGTLIPLGDGAKAAVPIGFTFRFYGGAFASVDVTSEGYLTFGSTVTGTHQSIPNPTAPNALIAAYWSNLDVTSGTVHYQSLGSAPNRQLVVQWTNARLASDPTSLLTLQVGLYETSDKLEVRYGTLTNASGQSATFGIENLDGTGGLQFAKDSPGFVAGGDRITVVPPWQLLRTIPSHSTAPQGLGLDAASGDLLVVDPTSTDTVRRVKTDGTLVSTNTIGTVDGRGVDGWAAGNLGVVDFNANRMNEYALGSSTLLRSTRTSGFGTSLESLALNPLDGQRLFVNQNTLYRLGSWFGDNFSVPSAPSLQAVAVNPATGEMWVSEYNSHLIIRLDPNGAVLGTINLNPSGAGDPNGLYYDAASNRLYTADNVDDRIYEFDTTTTPAVVLKSTWVGAHNMTVQGVTRNTASGELHIVGEDREVVRLGTQFGDHFRVVPGTTGVDGVAYDSDRAELWVLTATKLLLRFASDGTALGSYGPFNALATPTGLWFDPRYSSAGSRVLCMVDNSGRFFRANYDPAANTVTSQGSQRTSGISLVAGLEFVRDTSSNELLISENNGAASRIIRVGAQYGEGMPAPADVQGVTTDGTSIYMLNAGSGNPTVTKFDPATGAQQGAPVTIWANTPGGAARDIAIQGANTLLVLDQGRNVLWEVNATTGANQKWVHTTRLLTGPEGLARQEGTGELALVNASGSSGSVVRVVSGFADFSVISAGIPGGTSPLDIQGIAHDTGTGKVYVVAAGRNQLYRFSTSGGFEANYPLPNLALRGLSFDPASRRLLILEGSSSRPARVLEVEVDALVAGQQPQIVAALGVSGHISSAGAAGVVRNPQTGGLAVADTTTIKILGTGAGQGTNLSAVDPADIARDPANDELWVLHDGAEDRLVVINPSTWLPVAGKGFFVGFQATAPTGVALDLPNDRVLVVAGNGRLHEYTATGTHLKTTRLDHHTPASSGIVKDPSGDLWISDSSLGRLARIPAAFGDHRDLVVLGASSASGVTAGTSGNLLWLVDNTSTAVREVDPVAGTIVRSFSLAGGAVPTGLAKTAAGNLLVVSDGAQQIQEWDPNTSSLVVAKPLPFTGTPTGVAISTAGTSWFVTDASTDSIHEVDAGTGALIRTASTAAFAADPQDIAWAANGNLVVVDRAAGAMVEVDPTSLTAVGSSFSTRAYGSFGPTGAVQVASGYQVVDAGEDRVFAMAATGLGAPAPLSLVSLGCTSPTGLNWADVAGAMAVSCQTSDRIYKIDPNTGAQLGTSVSTAAYGSFTPSGQVYDGTNYLVTDPGEDRLFFMSPSGLEVDTITAASFGATALSDIQIQIGGNGAPQHYLALDIGADWLYKLSLTDGTLLSSFSVGEAGTLDSTGVAWDGTQYLVCDNFVYQLSTSPAGPQDRRWFRIPEAGPTIVRLTAPAGVTGVLYTGSGDLALSKSAALDEVVTLDEVTGAELGRISTQPFGCFNPTGLTYHNSNFLVVDNFDDRAFWMAPSGLPITPFSIGASATQPSGITLRGGNIAVADANLDRIVEYTPSGTQVSAISALAFGAGFPTGLAFDGTNYRLLDSFERSLFAMAPTGLPTFEFSTTGYFSTPSDIAYHPGRGTLFLVDRIQNEMAEVNLDGSNVRRNNIAVAGVINPFGVAIDGNGAVRVAETAGIVYRLPADGVSVQTYSLPAQADPYTGVTGLDFDPETKTAFLSNGGMVYETCVQPTQINTVKQLALAPFGVPTATDVTVNRLAGELYVLSGNTIYVFNLPPAPEQGPPGVAITAPTEGSMLANQNVGVTMIFAPGSPAGGACTEEPPAPIDPSSLLVLRDGTEDVSSLFTASTSGATGTVPFTSDGLHELHAQISDTEGRPSSVEIRRFTIDTTPPVLEELADLLGIEQASAAGAVVNYTPPTATDALDPNPVVTCSPAPGSVFPLGNTTVTCTATDAAGNTSSDTFVVNVVDTTAPTLGDLTPVVREATGPAGATATFPNPTASDVCDASLTVVMSPPSGSNFPLGASNVTGTATDDSGNVGTRVYTGLVTVVDTTPPMLEQPADISVPLEGPNGTVVTWQTPNATDLVDPTPTVVCSPASGTLFPSGTTVVTCTATDNFGNFTTVTFNVTVGSDTTPPTIGPVADITVEQESAAGTVVSYSAPTVSDDIDPNPSLTCLPASGSTFPLGSTTVTCTASDASGNTSSKTFVVNVVDTTDPTLSQPENMTVPATGPEGAVVSYEAPTASDVCDTSPTVTCSPASGSTFPLGVTTVTCTATDDSGNSASVTFTVTVGDTVPPVLADLPADQTVEQATAAGTVVTWTGPTATDAVDPAPTVTCSPASGSTFALGVHTVTCTATDASGNTSEATFTVTVVDTTDPTLAELENLTVEAMGSNGSVVSFPTPGATDICDAAVSVTCSPASGSQFPLGTTTVTVTASDDSGNDVSGTFTVLVRDSAAPTFPTPPANITVEQASAAGTVVTFTTPASIDVVDPNPSESCSPASGTTFPLGTTTVTCTATDFSGNSSTVTFTVTVRDTTAPTISAGNVTAEATGPSGAAVTFTPSVSDVCDAEPSVTSSPASGSTFALGETTVTVTATDASGNSASETFTVTVRDTTAPTLGQLAGITVEQASAAGTAVSYSPTATDLVDPTPTVVCTPASGTTFALGAHTVTVTATDDAGNTASGSFTVTVVDTTAPVLTSPGDITVQTEDPNGAVVTFPADQVSDVCDASPVVVHNPPSGSVFPVGTTQVTCSATDASGNVGLGGFTVTVELLLPNEDTTPPELIGVPEDMEIEQGQHAGAIVNYTPPTAIDDQDPNPTVTCEPATGTMFPLGTTVVTCTATDASGNSSSATFLVTVHDTVPPELAAPAALELVVEKTCPGLPADDPRIQAWLALAKAHDHCDANPKVLNDAPETFEVGATDVMFTAVDYSGNDTSASSTLKLVVVDTLTIEIVAPTNGACLADEQVTVQWVVQGAPATVTLSGTRTLAGDTTAAGPGPSYALQGDYLITATATTASGQTASDTVAFSIDRTAPKVKIRSPEARRYRYCPEDQRNLRFRLGNHPDSKGGVERYGLRLDELFNVTKGRDVFTFDFEAKGAEVWLSIEGEQARVHGKAFGGRERIKQDKKKDKWDPTYSGWVEIQFTFAAIRGVQGDDDLIVTTPDLSNSGTIVWKPGTRDEKVIKLWDVSGCRGFTFRLGDESDDRGHRGHRGTSGWGWLNHGTKDRHVETSEWLFTAERVDDDRDCRDDCRHDRDDDDCRRHDCRSRCRHDDNKCRDDDCRRGGRSCDHRCKHDSCPERCDRDDDCRGKRKHPSCRKEKDHRPGWSSCCQGRSDFPITVDVTAHDDDGITGGVKQLVLRLDNVELPAGTTELTAELFEQLDLDILGRHVLEARAVDMAGNSRTALRVFEVVLSGKRGSCRKGWDNDWLKICFKLPKASKRCAPNYRDVRDDCLVLRNQDDGRDCRPDRIERDDVRGTCTVWFKKDKVCDRDGREPKRLKLHGRFFSSTGPEFESDCDD